MAVTITPLEHELPFGAVVTLPEGISNPLELSDEDFTTLRNGLMSNLVLVVPGQADLDPRDQVKLTQRIDPSCTGNYGHDVEKFRHKDSVLRRDGYSVPDAPQVQILGQGKVTDYKGIPELNLRHPIHDDFHRTPLSKEEQDSNYTRFYRWHLDSALYGLSPPMATTLLGIKVPASDHAKYTVKYDDGTGDELKGIAQAATAFVNTNNSYELLSEEDKKFALNHVAVYAPHPYIFISPARAVSNGLTMVSEGKELPLDKLPPWEESGIKKLPLVWKNPVTGKPHLQAHGCCIWRIEDKDGNVVHETEEARKKVHDLLRPGISPKYVYAHPWTQGDLIIFFNRGVIHSVTGQFKEGETRIMHQCNIASGADPEPYTV